LRFGDGGIFDLNIIQNVFDLAPISGILGAVVCGTVLDFRFAIISDDGGICDLNIIQNVFDVAPIDGIVILDAVILGAFVSRTVVCGTVVCGTAVSGIVVLGAVFCGTVVCGAAVLDVGLRFGISRFGLYFYFYALLLQSGVVLDIVTVMVVGGDCLKMFRLTC
jgi:hypothetical protein